MKTSPITSPRPTNTELARGINQLHHCLEASIANSTRDRHRIQASVNDIRTHLGLDKVGTHKGVSTLSQRTAFFAQVGTIGGTISALFLGWKVWVFWAWPALKALSAFILHHT